MPLYKGDPAKIRGGQLVHGVDYHAAAMTKGSHRLPCSCWIDANGKWHLGPKCRDLNCGECRLHSQMHPFTTKRITDLMGIGSKLGKM